MGNAINQKPAYLRALMKMHLGAMGTPVEELSSKPVIGIVNSWNELVQGHYPQRELAERVKKGIYAAGGIAFEFNTIGICDGIAQGHEGMKYSLPSRELIYYSVEAMVKGHGIFDGLVFIGSCDKIVPAFLKSAFNLNIPSIFIGSGPAYTMYKPELRKLSRNEFVKGEISEDELIKRNIAYYSGPGVCPFLGTANTMNIMVEALGLSLPYSSTALANTAERLSLAEKTGSRIVELVEKDMKPSKIVTSDNFYNALVVLLAIGGSLNAVMHLIEIAHTANCDISLSLLNDLYDKIPLLVKIDPNDNQRNMIDFHKEGGLPQVMYELKDVLKLNAVAVDGLNIAERLETLTHIKPDKKEVIRSFNDPYSKNSGVLVLYGNIAPEGSLLKTASTGDVTYFEGPAVVFEREEDCRIALENGEIQEGQVIVIRNEGPVGGPGMREMHRISEMIKQFKNVALITDGRFSGASVGLIIGYVSPEAAEGGPISKVRNGDIIAIDLKSRTINCHTNPEIKGDASKHYEVKIPTWLDIYRKFASSSLKGGGMRI